MSRRGWALKGAAVTVAAGLAVREWGGGDFAKYAGDALYTVLVCAVIVAVAPRLRTAVAAGIALAFSWAVELAQIVGIPDALQPLLGSTFNAPDLFWYAVGAAVCWGAGAKKSVRVNSSRTAAKPLPEDVVRD